ncbi:MAG: carboxypeptidase regulatory-like domain-containing protein [Planctomycetes bacterium]|nr:carboxypeptidase regulatory-like domain-containing protein [Planctomycetota bacterium]
MKPRLLLPCLVMLGCAGPAGSVPLVEPAAPEVAWSQASAGGPVLIGEVRHPDGRPLAGVVVTLHGGFATRWRLATARTDAAGRFRFDTVEGSLIRDEQREEWDFYVGVCVGSVSGANPAEFLPWVDLRVRRQPGVVVRQDFVFDPESVPERFRG